MPLKSSLIRGKSVPNGITDTFRYEGIRNENKNVFLNKSQTKHSHSVEKFLITSHIVLAIINKISN